MIDRRVGAVALAVALAGCGGESEDGATTPAGPVEGLVWQFVEYRCAEGTGYATDEPAGNVPPGFVLVVGDYKYDDEGVWRRDDGNFGVSDDGTVTIECGALDAKTHRVGVAYLP